MAAERVLQELDERIVRRSILSHPFYQAWEQGALSQDHLATYAKIYFPHVRAFPGYLAAAIAKAEDPSIRDELKDNLADELGNPAPHDELWLDFAEHVGLDRASVANAPAHPAATAMVETFERLSAESLAGGLAALYAYESQQPEVSQTKARGLRAHYGIDAPAGLAYFTVHEAADVRHREGERDALVACLEAGVPAELIIGAADCALDAYWGLLDGVCEEIGLPA